MYHSVATWWAFWVFLTIISPHIPKTLFVIIVWFIFVYCTFAYTRASASLWSCSPSVQPALLEWAGLFSYRCAPVKNGLCGSCIWPVFQGVLLVLVSQCRVRKLPVQCSVNSSQPVGTAYSVTKWLLHCNSPRMQWKTSSKMWPLLGIYQSWAGKISDEQVNKWVRLL